ncbi:hypothetical protein ACFQ4L_05205 [Lapidilactobacillus mulanensis]|uniref:Iron-sulfur cluster repair di-iron protein, ric n=1 Tax=Lapidilactobacillus mulanensis TaxID=2485999 RepID=A0ABW4DRB0_9LACO|nr:hypothetical protein [Lapidilactobacillus mulanensis]
MAAEIDNQNFIETEFPKLNFFTTQIVKVHGAHHPELAEVRELFVAMVAKLQNNLQADLTPEFTRLQVVTDDYEVPADACGAYQATYQLLHEFQTLELAE